MTTTTTTRGGTRPNAGRPTEGGTRRRVVCVTLDAAQIEAARRIGGGNISEGVRTALDAAKHASARRIEVWQHRTSGERYAVLTDSGRPIEASGPLHYEDADKIMAGETDIAWDESLADDINMEDEQVDDAMGAYRRVWPEPSA